MSDPGVRAVRGGDGGKCATAPPGSTGWPACARRGTLDSMVRHLHSPRAAVVAALLASSAAGGQEAIPASPPPDAAGSGQVNLFEGFETHVLDNGLRVW